MDIAHMCGPPIRSSPHRVEQHTDSDGILFSMSLAIGDDCEFVIGRATNRSNRLSERKGETYKIRMRLVWFLAHSPIFTRAARDLNACHSNSTAQERRRHLLRRWERATRGHACVWWDWAELV